MRIAVTGASGLIGSALVRSLDRDAVAVVRLVRRPPISSAEIGWDPAAPDGAVDPESLARLDAVGCLALPGFLRYSSAPSPEAVSLRSGHG